MPSERLRRQESEDNFAKCDRRPAWPAGILFVLMIAVPQFIGSGGYNANFLPPLLMPFGLPAIHNGNISWSSLSFLLLYSCVVAYTSFVVNPRHRQRLQTAAFWIPVMIGSLLFFPFIFRTLLVYFAVYGIFEYRAILAPIYRAGLRTKSDREPNISTDTPGNGISLGNTEMYNPPVQWPLAAFAAFVGAASFGGIEFYGLALLLSLSAMVLTYPAFYPGETWLVYIMLDSFGLLYVPWSLNICGILLDHPYGQGLVFMALSCSWIGDGGAYFIGSRYGRHKCHPSVSPGKSWEGCGAELFWTAATALGLRWLQSAGVTSLGIPDISPAHCVAFAAVLTVTGVTGDLCESFIKRLGGMKDSGDFFPGHGGVLDRFDGFFFAAVIVLAYLLLLHGLPSPSLPATLPGTI